jgi:hypothetical protein
MPVAAPETHRRALVVLLRAGGVVTCTAFLAVLLPTDWMAAIHEGLGLGPFPRAAVVDYLARSVAAFYGFHGVLLFVIASDPARHGRIVRYVGVMNVVFGAMLVGIDLDAGMPVYWTLAEGPPVIAIGIAVLYLSRSL